MLDREEAERIIAAALDASRADQTEAVLIGTDSALTRYAQCAIHQNLAERQTRLHVRAAVDRRVGCASTNALSGDAIADVAAQACEIARHSAVNEAFRSLPHPAQIPHVLAWSEATADFSAQRRAEVVAEISDRAQEAGLEASGAVRRDCEVVAVGNSLGVFSLGRRSEARATVLASGATGTGWARFQGYDVGKLDVAGLSQRAIEKALRSAGPRAIEPGEYAVILEPEAVAEMLDMLAYSSFSAKAYLEGRSFMSRRMGSQVASEKVTIADDAFDPDSPGLGFDYEGVPKRRVELISRGIAAGVVWDSDTAALAGPGQESTGHALLPPNPFGPYPSDLVMEAGDSSLEEMVLGADRAILVTRFHYTNLVHELRTVITGMTRDGTFLVEGGRVVAALKNLRFTQSILEALSRVEAVSRDRQAVEGSLVPALFLSSFRFTGGTKFVW